MKKCQIEGCSVDLDILLTSLDNGEEKTTLCLNHLAMYGDEVFLNKEIKKEKSTRTDNEECECCKDITKYQIHDDFIAENVGVEIVNEFKDVNVLHNQKLNTLEIEHDKSKFNDVTDFLSEYGYIIDEDELVTIEYKDSEATFYLCSKHLKDLLYLNLSPQGFKTLYNRVGSIHILHDDFYDPETGEAFQPRE